VSDIRWQQVWDVFYEALDLTPEQRVAFLAKRCANDSELLREAEDLLSAHEASENILKTTPWISDQHLEPGPGVGDEIDSYRLLNKLGEGGSGIVFEAQQFHPIERHVALKLIKAGMDSRDVLRRFASERQSLALMNHPGIAQVFDAGVSEQGHPYFVMELVKGQPITRFCDEHSYSIDQRIELFRSVCLAVQHAHQKGVIHRDLKPSNVLVTMIDGQPQTKVIDFGIARALHRQTEDQPGFTKIGQLIGTPEYMSPEQARVNNLDVDTRTDIYSLGVMLYEILIGTLPFETDAFRSGDYLEFQRILRDEEPLPPSVRLRKLGVRAEESASKRGMDEKRLVKKLSGDLDWVVMKALEKDRTRRYDSVGELSADLSRFLEQRTVNAHPPRASYRLKKFIARHKIAFIAATVATLATLAAIVGITMGLIVANRERQRAETVSQFLQDMLLASQPENARGRDTTYLQGVLKTASQRVDKELKDQPEAASSLHYTIALTYKSLGLYEEASKHLESALRLRQEHLGKDHELTAETMSELATLRWQQDDYKNAEALARQALAIQDRIYKPENNKRLFTLNTLGLIMKSTGRFSDAEKLYREVAEIRRRTLGIQDLSTLTSVSNLARLLEDQGKLDEAAKLMREVVDVGVKAQGEDDPFTLVSIDILGVLMRKEGRLDEAEQLHRRALAGCIRVLGEKHVDTLGVRRNLAVLLIEQGKLPEAESQLRNALTTIVREYGEQTFYTLSISHALGDCLYKQGKNHEASEMYNRALTIGRQILPKDHPLLKTLESKQERVSDVSRLYSPNP
jgi:eukaryotic-like serine/threonine-protein kinase